SKRFSEEAVADGPAEGQTFRLSEMLPEYYSIRGWDSEGRATKETLDKLGLEGP
ncbi:hypothetical protein LCGC14_2298710, partial [marine sediment metagenome]